MRQAVLLLGSNLGDRQSHLDEARRQIDKQIGNISRLSSVYQSEAHGYESSNQYMNQVLVSQTNLDPFMLLLTTQSIENSLGRVRNPTTRYSDRTIDIDILFYDSEVIKSQSLIIPHPRIQERLFVLEPVIEIMPDFRHPVLKLTMTELLEKLK